MDLGEVGTFVRVVDTGSMHGAARVLGLPRSTVSRRIARLEEILGVRLIERTTRKMALTEEGQRFYERVAPAIEVIAAAGAEAQESGDEPTGTLRVTAPVDFGQAVLGDIVAEFLRLHPKVRVEVDLSNRYVDLVQEGFDLAIRAGALSDSSLVARRLVFTELWLLASPAYLEARGVPERPNDLTKHDCVLFRPHGASMRWRLQRAEQRDGEAVTVDVDGRAGTSEFAFLQRLVLSGIGIGPLPAFLAMKHLEEGRLVRVLPAWLMGSSAMHIVTPSGRHLPAKVKAFRDFLVEKLREPSGAPR